LPIWEKIMTAEAVAGRQHSRRTKPGASAAKSAAAARLAHIGTNGLGAEEDDLTFFLGLAPSEQSRLIRDGMEAVIVSRIATELLDIPVQTLLASLRLPSSTINRKISQGERLSASESDRAARTMLIYAQAKDVLEDGRLAAEWLLRPNVELGGERPLDTLDTQTGFDRVRDLLIRLEHGVTV
jgi:putative toxin-antitoxin system antitoxin component (TIGR02293 family)